MFLHLFASVFLLGCLCLVSFWGITDFCCRMVGNLAGLVDSSSESSKIRLGGRRECFLFLFSECNICNIACTPAIVRNKKYLDVPHAPARSSKYVTFYRSHLRFCFFLSLSKLEVLGIFLFKRIYITYNFYTL